MGLLIDAIQSLNSQPYCEGSAYKTYIEERLKSVIKRGGRLDEKDSKGQTPLIHAILIANPIVVEFILNKSSFWDNCLLEHKDKTNMSALFHAVNFKDVQEIAEEKSANTTLLTRQRNVLELILKQKPKISWKPVESSCIYELDARGDGDYVHYFVFQHVLIKATEASNIRFIEKYLARNDIFLSLKKVEEKYRYTHSEFDSYFEYFLPAAITGGMQALQFWSAYALSHAAQVKGKHSFFKSTTVLEVQNSADKIFKKASNYSSQILSHVFKELNSNKALRVGLKISDAEFLINASKNIYFEKYLTSLPIETLAKYLITACKTKLKNYVIEILLEKIGNATPQQIKNINKQISIAFIYFARAGEYNLTKTLLLLNPTYQFDLKIGLPKENEYAPNYKIDKNIAMLLTTVHYILQQDNANMFKFYKTLGIDDRRLLMDYSKYLNPSFKMSLEQMDAELANSGLLISNKNNINNVVQPPAYEKAVSFFNINDIAQPPTYEKAVSISNQQQIAETKESGEKECKSICNVININQHRTTFFKQASTTESPISKNELPISPTFVNWIP